MNTVFPPHFGISNGVQGPAMPGSPRTALRFGFAPESPDAFLASSSEADEPKKGFFKKLGANAKHYGAKTWTAIKKYGLPATAIVGGSVIGVLGVPFYVVPPVGVALHIAGGALALYGLWKGYQKWKAADA